MRSETRSRQQIRFRGRSFMALVLAPEAPVVDWLADLDALMERSPGFFTSRPIVLDAAALPPNQPELAGLVADLKARGIRVVSVEGVDPAWAGTEGAALPMISGGRPAADIPLPEEPKGKPAKSAKREVIAERHPTSLLIDAPVRSGQTVHFPHGDVTVVGSVASGAEIIAGGSIHIYGALRGRAFAGCAGNRRARIFCRKLEAELIAIDGYYRTADDMDQKLVGHAVRAWLDGEAMKIATMD